MWSELGYSAQNSQRRGTPAVEPRAVSSPDPLTRHQAAGGGDKSGRQAGAAQHGDHERSKLLQAEHATLEDRLVKMGGCSRLMRG